MNKIKSLFKASPIAMVVIGLLVAGVASAALLTLYVTMTGTMEVKQSVVFEGYETEHAYEIGDSPAHAGNTYIYEDKLYNTSETTAPIELVTTYSYGGSSWWAPEEGIETSYWSSVELSSKDTNWAIIPGGKATLTYELAASTFNYEFEATVLTPGESYSLIYYADEPNRFVDWGGNNPGRLIANFTADDSGNIYAEGTETEPVKGSINLGIDLPHANDWNGTSEANYCNNANGHDSYDLCRGAKIWLVLANDYSESTKTLTGWNPDSYLFETDLITYDDTDTIIQGLNLGTGMLNFFVKNVLDIALAPQQYMVKTEIVPAL